MRLSGVLFDFDTRIQFRRNLFLDRSSFFHLSGAWGYARPPYLADLYHHRRGIESGPTLTPHQAVVLSLSF